MKIEDCMNYLDTKNFMNSNPGLENIEALMEELGNPQDTLKFIHIAGINGKGSTAAFLDKILQESGYKTGVYTSPYILHFSEKIKVNGKEITEQEIIRFTKQIYEAEQAIRIKKNLCPTVFERVTALAFLYFASKKCDIVVLETGLGGRLDVTNIIKTTEVAVITTIGFDHTEILGNTKEKITVEKAGIIKPGCDVVLYQQENNVMQVLTQICKEKNARIVIAEVNTGIWDAMSQKGQVFSYKQYRGLTIGMLGMHQVKNAITALCTIECLQKKGWNIQESAIRSGLEKARWIGRLEVRMEKPLFLVDAAHNPEGVSVLAESLETLFPKQKKIFVVGVLSDKAYEEMLDLIVSQADCFFVATPNSTRALNGDRLAELLQKKGFFAQSYISVADAVHAAIEKAKEENHIICAFGSLYYIGDVISYLSVYKNLR